MRLHGVLAAAVFVVAGIVTFAWASSSADAADPAVDNGLIDVPLFAADYARGLYTVDPGLGASQTPVARFQHSGAVVQDVSPDGSMILYQPFSGAGTNSLRVYDTVTGDDEQILPASYQVRNAAWSPDGNYIIVFSFDQGKTWVLDLAAQAVTEVDFGEFDYADHVVFSPVWSPGSWKIAMVQWLEYLGRRTWVLATADIDLRTGVPSNVVAHAEAPFGRMLVYSPDGNWVITESIVGNTAQQPLWWDCSWPTSRWDLTAQWVGSGAPPLGFEYRNLTTSLRDGTMTPGVDRGLDQFYSARISPDGSKIAFGRHELRGCSDGALQWSDGINLWTADLSINDAGGDFLTGLAPHTDFGPVYGGSGMFSGRPPWWHTTPETNPCIHGPDLDGDGLSDCVERIRGSDPNDKWSPGPPGTWTPIDLAKPFLVALGDSYASGEGVTNYDGDTNESGVNRCHRSYDSYPFEANSGSLANAYNVISLACSGAKAEDLTHSEFCGTECGRRGDEDHSDSKRYENPQLEDLQRLVDAGAQIDVVTLGIGGNDGGFSDIVKWCTAGTNCVERFDPLVGGTPPGDTDVQIAAKAESVLRSIHTIVPDATVVVVGYPVWMSLDGLDCPAGVGANEGEWIRGLIQSVNGKLAGRVDALMTELAPFDVRYAGLESVYGNYVHCSSESTNFVHALVPPIGDYAGCLTIKSAVCQESYHPTVHGHSVAGAAVASCIKAPSLCEPPSLRDARQPWELVDPINWDFGCPEGFLERAAGGDPICVLHVDTAFNAYWEFATENITDIIGVAFSVSLLSDPVNLATGTVSASGTATAAIAIPSTGVSAGEHTLLLTLPGTTTIHRAAKTTVIVTNSSSDYDDDGVLDASDNCVIVANASQNDGDHDGVGDLCDAVHFADTDGHWAVDSIEAVYTSGITRGCATDPLLFCPDDDVTRAEITAFILRAIGQDMNLPAYQALFPDVPAGKWFTGYVEKAAQLELVKGYTDGDFGPDDQLNRAEMAVVIIRALGELAPPTPVTDPFEDVPKDSWYGPYVARLRDLGITVGYGDNTYGPYDPITRAEVATMIQRAWKLAMP